MANLYEDNLDDSSGGGMAPLTLVVPVWCCDDPVGEPYLECTERRVGDLERASQRVYRRQRQRSSEQIPSHSGSSNVQEGRDERGAGLF